jgi:hypothetical protein
MNNRTGLFIVMAIVAGVGMLYVNLSHAPKKPPASAARIQSPQQNECVTTATLDYNKIKLERFEQLQQNLSPTAILSVEKTIEERRLQEQYCQRFARCLFDPGGNEVAALSYASAFDSCLRDETLEHYDAVPRENADKDVDND